ncbi:MAG: sigma-70 family RNA polymerase sigma factor [Planctomycetes bacterium]|nr:sigma-70 family RNA polymerase sigma factor [Planctomycetota bacterium]
MPDTNTNLRKSQSVVNPAARFIDRLKKGEPSAMEEALKKNSGAIYRFLYRFLGDRKQADDVLEQVMVSFVRSIPSLGENDTVEVVLWREAHKAAVKSAFGGGGPSAPRAGGKKKTPAPGYMAESGDPDIKRLVSAWEELDPPYREALALSGIEPLIDYDDASSIIEGTQGTLRSRLTYALRRLLKEV